MDLVDLERQRARISQQIDRRIASVLEHGRFVMGPEVVELEQALSDLCGARNTVTCASGTDALILPLMAWGIGPGDAVFVPSFTFAATAEAVLLVGATPVFVDVLPDTFNMDPSSLRDAIESIERLRPAAVIPVDLFGLPADYEACRVMARAHGLRVLADGAQSFGAQVGSARVGTLAEATATSFFPAKPLGCYGDGGAVFTDDDDTAETLRSLRVHGQGSHKYENVRVGTNARLDTIQAAILLEKLKLFEDELAKRASIAQRYEQGLAGTVSTPRVDPSRRSAWAQYTVRVPRRDEVADRLSASGVPTAIYYPRPLHRQPAYASCPIAPAGLPVSERLSVEVLSIPVHPYLLDDEVETVIRCLNEAVEAVTKV